MITVLFSKKMPGSIISPSMQDLWVYRVLDVPIIQPQLRVYDGDWWEALVEYIVVKDGVVCAECNHVDATPSFNRNQEWHIDWHVNRGWFDNRGDAWNAYHESKKPSKAEEALTIRDWTNHAITNVGIHGSGESSVSDVGRGADLGAGSGALRVDTGSGG